MSMIRCLCLLQGESSDKHKSGFISLRASSPYLGESEERRKEKSSKNNFAQMESRVRIYHIVYVGGSESRGDCSLLQPPLSLKAKALYLVSSGIGMNVV